MAIIDSIMESMNFIIEATVYEDSKNNMRVFVAPSTSRKFGKKAYFKVYNHKTQDKATKVARICFYKAAYVVHDKDPDGCKTWVLNDSQIKTVIEILNSRPTNKRNKYDTVWQELIFRFNERVSSLHPDDTISIDLPMPDYTDLKKGEVI